MSAESFPLRYQRPRMRCHLSLLGQSFEEKRDDLIAAIQDDLPAETAYQVPCGLWAGTLTIVLPAHEAYEVTVSTEKGITLTLMDPGMLDSAEMPVDLTKTAEGYRFDIPAAE